MENSINYKKVGIIAALVAYDFIMTFVACLLALLIKEHDFDSIYYDRILYYGLIFSGVSLLIFTIFKLYNGVWRYASVNEFSRVLTSCLLLFTGNVVFCLLSQRYMLVSWSIITLTLQLPFILASRFAYRLLRYYKKKITSKKEQETRVMIVGAGDAGLQVCDEMINTNSLGMRPILFIDDNPLKTGSYVRSIKVEGNRNDIIRLAEQHKIDMILISMPSVGAKDLADIINICKETKCKVKTLPGLYQFVNSESLISGIRDVSVADLLGREQIKVNLDEINGYIKDKVVLVTGGGGSIGSELCRQIAKSEPKKLIILDIYENNAYDIQLELLDEYPNLDLLVLIASVRDKNKIDDVFKTYKPDLVYHAAAHKHVPLMETSPNEAIKNNVFGTLNVAKAADKYGVKRFVMISTDKAVNPTNIMGASKRICEMIVQTLDKHSNTEFVATRFGNVLGSNGSVVPLFKKQIEKGGPVTVTHKDIIRYFMTIPEAVSLVLQAGSYAKGGEIFVLDMGEPVRIYDLAVNLIKLSGKTPNVDIKIECTGLRPGEKLYEEMLMKEEGIKDTPNKLIHIGKPIELDEDNFFNLLDDLYVEAYKEVSNMKEIVQKLVPTYKITDNKK